MKTGLKASLPPCSLHFPLREQARGSVALPPLPLQSTDTQLPRNLSHVQKAPPHNDCPPRFLLLSRALFLQNAPMCPSLLLPPFSSINCYQVLSNVSQQDPLLPGGNPRVTVRVQAPETGPQVTLPRSSRGTLIR